MDSAAMLAEASVRHWNIADFPAPDRFGVWSEILSSTHLPFAADLRRELRKGFTAEVREHRLGEMALVETSVEPHRGVRTRRQLAANTRDIVGLHFIESGSHSVSFDNVQTVMGPGDVLIWDGEVVGEYEILEPMRKKTLIIPRSVAATALPTYRTAFVRALPRDDQPTRTIITVLDTLAVTLPTMGSTARMAAAALVTALLKPLDEMVGGPAERTRVSKLELRERVLHYIDSHLGEQTLSAATIAAAHSVSVRTLYSALDGLGMTLGTYIRNRRLARCYEDLRDTDVPVSTIAQRWGFASPSHFSRVFHERYDIAPGRLRRG